MFDATKKIESIADVKNFFSYLITDEKVNFHPDDPFSEYIDDNGIAVFSKDKANMLDERMSECFEICENADEDIYELAYDALSVALC